MNDTENTNEQVELFYKRHLVGAVSLDGYDAIKLLVAISPTTGKDAIKQAANTIRRTANLHSWPIQETIEWYSHKIEKYTLKYWLLLAAQTALTTR